MTWLRPTWTTAAVLLLPAALLALSVLLQWDWGAFALFALLIQLPFDQYYRLGLPVGRRGDWFGFANPSALGWALIAATDLLALYLLGSLTSAAWRRGTTR